MVAINLPKGWNLLPLNQICDLQNGYAFKSSDYVNVSSTLNCRMSNIRPNGFFDLEHNQRFLPDSYTEKYQQYLLKDGDVIIAMTDMATEAKILGVPTIVETQGKNLLLNQRVGKLIIKKPELIYFPYLKYALNREQVKKYFLKFAGGGLQINLGKDDILSVEIPLPPLEEQKRIAEVLDRAEELRSKRREAIAQLNTLTQAIFLEMFGDPATNPKRWTVKSVGELASKFSDGPFGSNLKTSHYTEVGIRVIRLQNIGIGEFLDKDKAYISSEHFAKLKKHECHPGDVLIGTLGDPNLRACIQPDSLSLALNKADCVQLRANQEISHPAYICELLNQPAVERMAQEFIVGQTRLRISMGRLRMLKVPLPPLPLQQEFACRVEAVEKLKAAHRASLSELNALFASLQHRAFRGEL